MKGVLLVALASALASTATAGAKLSQWEDGENPRTHVPRISFALTKTQLGGFNVHTFSFIQVAWQYFITLEGNRSTYEKDRIVLTPFLLPRQSLHPTVTAGTVRVDRAKHKVVVALQLSLDGKIEDFPGNGEYEIPADTR